LDQYRQAVENARDPVGWKQLRRVLRLWRFHADAVGDPGYREALDAAPVPPVPGRRIADLGDFGFIEFIADEEKRLVVAPGDSIAGR
jgi:hypothetical protein